MPPNTRYTVRLPPALAALVQERMRASGTPCALLIREALAAYLADTPPTGPLTPPNSADTLRELQEQLATLTTRVEALEQGPSPRPIQRRQPAHRRVDKALKPADMPQVHTRGGQRKLTPRQVRALRAKRARGTPIKALMQEYGVSKATVFRSLA